MIEHYRSVTGEGKTIFTEVQLDLEAEDAEWMLWAFARLKTPEPAGCSASERQTLANIRDELETKLELGHGAAYAGMKLQDGWAEFYFYAAWGKGAEKHFRDVFSRHGYPRIEYGTNRDAAHAFYFESLYPDGYELQQIKDREILRELEAEGDDPSVPRVVEHYLFFKTPSAMQRCAETLSYAEIETGLEEEGEYPHGLLLRLTHSLEPETLAGVTRPLIDAAEKEHGIYLGWSTTLAP